MSDIFHEIEEKIPHRSNLKKIECIHCDFSMMTQRHPLEFEHWICEPRLKAWVRELVKEVTE